MCICPVSAGTTTIYYELDRAFLVFSADEETIEPGPPWGGHASLATIQEVPEGLDFAHRLLDSLRSKSGLDPFFEKNILHLDPEATSARVVREGDFVR